jgi:hypothetical protein
MADNQNELLTHIWGELQELRKDMREMVKDRQLWESGIALKVNGLEVDHQNRVRWSTVIAGFLFTCGIIVAGWVTNIQMAVRDLQQEHQGKP